MCFPGTRRPLQVHSYNSNPAATATSVGLIDRFGKGQIIILSLTGLLVVLCCASQCAEFVDARRKQTSMSVSHSESAPLVGSRSNQRDWPTWRKWLRAFCPEESVRRLFERSPTQALSGLDGLRSFSMIWIMLVSLSVKSQSQKPPPLPLFSHTPKCSW